MGNAEKAQLATAGTQSGKVDRDLTPVLQMAQERTQCADKMLGAAMTLIAAVALYESGDIRSG
ncbi:MAG: hypothetical protein MZV65_44740 [Chromatiales bacterium]|nr:hypothetical protein [Chromatiales bacterium]